MSMISLVTDRTAEHVARWKYLRALGFGGMSADQKAEWSAGMKGAYNAADLNRVGTAMAYLAGIFQDYGYAVTVSSRTDWAVTDIPSQAAMTAYLYDLAALRGVVAVMVSTPTVPPDMAGLWWHEANDIEKILMDVDTLLQSLGLVLQRAGQPLFFAGYGVYPASPGEPLLAEDTQEILAEDGTELFYY